MLVTVACEHSPIFLANVDNEGLLTLDFSAMQSVLEWYNSLTKDRNNLAYFLPDQNLFVFPENGEWTTFSPDEQGAYLCPDWFGVVEACPDCLCYIPCDCDLKLLTESEIRVLELSLATRRIAYHIRELEAQLKVEQETRK